MLTRFPWPTSTWLAGTCKLRGPRALCRGLNIHRALQSIISSQFTRPCAVAAAPRTSAIEKLAGAVHSLFRWRACEFNFWVASTCQPRSLRQSASFCLVQTQDLVLAGPSRHPPDTLAPQGGSCTKITDSVKGTARREPHRAQLVEHRPAHAAPRVVGVQREQHLVRGARLWCARRQRAQAARAQQLLRATHWSTKQWTWGDICSPRTQQYLDSTLRPDTHSDRYVQAVRTLCSKRVSVCVSASEVRHMDG